MTSSKDLAPITAPFFPTLFYRNQFRTKPNRPPKNTDLTGKVAIITGGNTGLGYESGRQLLSFKLSRLILAVRSPQRGEAAAKKLNATYPKATIEVWQLDMSSYDSIQAFVKRAESQLSRIDMVILNAGVWRMKFGTIPSTGHEEIIQVNYLSTMFMTILLLPVMKSRAPPDGPGHITIVSAALSLTAKPPYPKAPSILKAFDDPKKFSGGDHYNTSKVMAHMFMWKLAEYVSADDVIVNLADPGFVAGTALARDAPVIFQLLGKIFAALTARSLRDGASCPVDGVLLKGKESHCCFLMGWEIKPFATFLYTPEGKENIEKLWQETLDELSFANVRGILELMQKH